MPEIIAYTDGACSGNPGPGGWGVILQAKDGLVLIKERELFGGEKDTTNNRMELIAAISCLESLEKPTKLTLFTDSNYVKGGITEWMKTWKKNEWKTAGKKSVKNVDLWKRLDKARQKHNVTWKWVKGHSGQTENERADELARQGMAPYK
ncbi:MAG: ribonuclease HI [Rhodobacteraceae bacterium]|nr:ribonuclease HI [Paracoccaceae bacterium]|tara:strand:- start:1075 stop:1524 length:450 start_codon:yes stop_codon:yes gene_type:complete